LQAAAASGEIVSSRRAHEAAGQSGSVGELRELTLKGKSRPEIAVVCSVGDAQLSAAPPA
jgi:class 3 adenylate cyclase